MFVSHFHKLTHMAQKKYEIVYNQNTNTDIAKG